MGTLRITQHLKGALPLYGFLAFWGPTQTDVAVGLEKMGLWNVGHRRVWTTALAWCGVQFDLASGGLLGRAFEMGWVLVIGEFGSGL